jgi:two-component system, chemotaxis family, protein-glutamate methylesterase/glutaminase
MPKRNIIVIGGSSGSFESFKKIAAALPKDLDASIFIVWHMAPDVRSVLPQILNNVGPLFASDAREGERIESGRIYVARPDHHLLLDDSHIRVTRGPKENRFRPALDPLFRSAAYNYGPRSIGVVLSGALDDGTSGLWTIKHRGGLAVVQDPNDADISSMPENAIREVDVDHIVPVADMPELLVRLSSQEVPERAEGAMQDSSEDKRTRLEIRIAAEDNALEAGVMEWGELSPFTCPDCSGVLSKIKDGNRPRFRCHTGHAFSSDSLLAALTETIEESLWSAIRGVDESIMLLNHIGDHFAEVNQGPTAAKFFQKAIEAGKRNDLIRKAVFEHEHLSAESVIHEPDIDSAVETGETPAADEIGNAVSEDHKA